MVGLAERINALIRLAGSSNMNEARNAAYEACKLLRKHNIYLKTGSKPKTNMKEEGEVVKDKVVTIEVSPEKIETIATDYERAGYVYDEQASLEMMKEKNRQCAVLKRGNRVVVFVES